MKNESINIKESEAQTKLCPIDTIKNSNCCASGCMAWIETIAPIKKGEDVYAMEYFTIKRSKAKKDIEACGYCTLINKD